MDTEVKTSLAPKVNGFTWSTIVDRANDLLIYRQFDKCLNVCHDGVTEAKNFPENQRAVATIEALCVVAIQAYAELDRWQEVLPYINEIYTSIENCPTQIAQLCVLLHAHLKDYMTCAAITNVWVRHSHNYSHPDYHLLPEAFITKVLLPQERWDDVSAFLDSCPGLNPGQKDVYLKQVRHLRHRAEEASLDKIEELPPVEDGRTTEQDEELGSNRLLDDALDDWSVKMYSWPVKAWRHFSTYVKFVSKWISEHIPLVGLNIVKNVSLMAVILHLLISRANLEFLSYERLFGVWNALGKLWRAMFAPFHMARK